jgi:hypothetical protein
MKISKLLQIGLLLTFILPFFPKGCSPTSEEIEAQRISDSTRFQDSIAIVQAEGQRISDSINNSKQQDSIVKQNKDSVGVYQHNNSNDKNEITDKISKKSKILKSILRPNNNYTGIAFVIDLFTTFIYGFGVLIAFLLWIIGLIIKYKDYNNIFHLINIIGLITFYMTNPFMVNFFDGTKLWGFWISFIWALGLIIYDTNILIKRKRNKTVA